jgi:hypothetical protein
VQQRGDRGRVLQRALHLDGPIGEAWLAIGAPSSRAHALH